MKLLHVVSSVDRRFGGPIEGVLQRGLRLREMGHQIEVASSDDPGAAHVQAFPLPVHALGPPRRGGYYYAASLRPWLSAHAGSYDAVIVNGLWQYHSLAAWQVMRELRRPYVVFTHGMLDPWFNRAYPLKRLKKALYWPWAEYRVLRDAAAVLFTSEDERLLARRSFWPYQARERVVAYGTRLPPQDAAPLRDAFLGSHPELRGKRVLLFLGRLHAKKGCDLMVEAFARVAAEQPDLHLLMAGPDQTGWVSDLKARARALGLADRITWPGMLEGDAKWGAFYSSEAFMLPSHQENFGISVAEALGCGLPVLISDKVNIWREVMAAQAGFVAEDTEAGTLENLRAWLTLPTADRAAMSQRTHELFADRFSVDRMATALIDVVTAVQATARA
ncbi:glycosyltransferase [Bradyrhizobium diazoefficiens]|jgi:glycosyltransferase involved in cell wall biosynthesis|nr:glycosyltransferase [Bradyrhizobium diazoefficiens]UCF54259.1 MAG: glycosyltransferase [Bradyrhizobium sp.]MBR0964125.1 glycosyltransferase [Bradyrhizobium diazoefficiens]MBR0978285.1 glycosyltransferase [Bradyrhizobium diazoefficiens]MBR1006216.1 glycosyltransferase [Bradyrhizobium diazoefficiens]MBR1014268.1 glycosyltransferase [Bradyrhizobium diazoefficiens]